MSTAMIAITTNSSISVNPRRRNITAPCIRDAEGRNEGTPARESPGGDPHVVVDFLTRKSGMVGIEGGKRLIRSVKPHFKQRPDTGLKTRRKPKCRWRL